MRSIRLAYMTGLVLLTLSIAAPCLAQSDDDDAPHPPVKSYMPGSPNDGGINTGTGTIPNGDLKDSEIQGMQTNPGSATESGGVNSGPASSLPRMDIIPGSGLLERGHP